jgi:hypothetical protein
VLFFRVWRGELRGPVPLSLDENVPSPLPLDRQLHNLFDSLAGGASPPASAGRTHVGAHGHAPAQPSPSPTPQSVPGVPPWEHLSLLARWYYSSFREDKLVMLNAERTIPTPALSACAAESLPCSGPWP